MWAYAHLPFGSTVDYADAIEAQIEKCAEYVINLVGRYVEWQGTLDFVVEIRPAAASPYSGIDGLLPSVGQIGWNGSAWVNETLAECLSGFDSDPSRPVTRAAVSGSGYLKRI